MARALGLLLCCTLTACLSAGSHVRYVPVEEAAWFKFGSDLPKEGRVELSGTQVAAMQMAAGHFLPWNGRYPSGADRSERCALQRQSWDVETAPGEAGATLIRFVISPGACFRWGPPLDMDATYEVDVPQGKLRDRDPMQPPPELPREGRLRLEGNTAAAIQLALEDLLPGSSSPPEGTRPEERCLYRHDAYGVEATSEPWGVVQVRFTVDEKTCPTQGLWGNSAPLATLDRSVYAVDVRTMRILAVGNHAHLRPMVQPPASPETTPGTSTPP